MVDADTAFYLLTFCLFAAAALYTSVGHAGASAYIAAMALFGIAPPVMRPTALVLNILVSLFASVRYYRAGLFRWRGFWPFAAGALPLAAIGGALQLPGQYYRPLVGVLLLAAAARLLWPRALRKSPETTDVPVAHGVAIGGAIGLLSGLTGTGGGIFLSPILLFMGWSETRAASGIAAVFILCNSVAGLLGNISSVKALPAGLPWFAAAVLLGAVAGTQFGIVTLAKEGVVKALGLVLIVAGIKLIGVY